MTKEELRKNTQFQTKCEEMDLNSVDFNVYDGIILAKTLFSNLYVYLDNNFNVLHIGPSLYGNTNNPEESAYLLKYAFMKYYPLTNFSLWDIMQLGEKIDEIEYKIGIPSGYRILNLGQEPDPNTIYYLEMMCLIQFIKDEVGNYYERSLPLVTNGFNIPEVVTYINNMLNNLVQVILNSERLIYIKDFLSQLGLKCTDENSKQLSYIICNVLRRYGLPVYGIADNETLTNSYTSTLDHNFKKILNIRPEDFAPWRDLHDINDIAKRLNGDNVPKR